MRSLIALAHGRGGGEESVLLITNSSFQANVTGWVANDTEVVAWNSGHAIEDGSGCMSVNNASGSAKVIWGDNTGPGAALNGLKILSFSAMYRSLHLDVATPDVATQAELSFYADATWDNYISGEYVPIVDNVAGGDFVTAKGTWSEMSRVGIHVPDGAAYVDIVLRTTGLDSTDPILFDNVMCWGVK